MTPQVTAKKRPKNSALEVELDFEHNVRPPPVITEEVTASLEDMIKARISEVRSTDARTETQATKCGKIGALLISAYFRSLRFNLIKI